MLHINHYCILLKTLINQAFQIPQPPMVGGFYCIYGALKTGENSQVAYA